MEKVLNEYLEKIEKCLKPLPVAERVDIVKEIQSEMSDLQSGGKTPEEIVARLGKPKELARAYLGDLIARSGSFSWTRILALCAYYSLAGLSGLIVIPCLGIIAPTFLLCAAVCPILGAVKFLDSLFRLGLPYVQNIGIFLDGIAQLTPAVEFAGCLVISVLFYLGGRACWKLLVCYIKGVSKVRDRLPL